MKAVLLSVLLLTETRVAAESGAVGEACREVLKTDYQYHPADAAGTNGTDPEAGVVKMAKVVVLAPNFGRELEKKLDEQVARRAAIAAAEALNLRLAGTQIGNTLVEVGVWWNPVDERRGLMRQRNLGVKAELIRIKW